MSQPQTTFPQSLPAPTAVADIMQPPLTTVERYDHVAAAAYLMRHAGATSLMVLDASTDRLIGIVTEADVAHAVADGKDVNEIRIHDVMATRPTVITPATSIRDAAKIMTSRGPQIRRSPHSCSSAARPSPTTCGRFSSSSASPRVTSLHDSCLAEAVARPTIQLAIH